jgi:hypothetical protein
MTAHFPDLYMHLNKKWRIMVMVSWYPFGIFNFFLWVKPPSEMMRYMRSPYSPNYETI